MGGPSSDLFCSVGCRAKRLERLRRSFPSPLIHCSKRPRLFQSILSRENFRSRPGRAVLRVARPATYPGKVSI